MTVTPPYLLPDAAAGTALVRKLFERHGFHYSDLGVFDCNFGGVRAPRPVGDPNPVRFDDILFCARGTAIEVWRGTLDAGTENVVGPVNARGAGAVAPVQQRGVWDLGTYKTRPGLLQVGSMWGVRDNDRDVRHRIYDMAFPATPLIGREIEAAKAALYFPGETLLPLHGTHWHYMGRGADGRPVGPWSAACVGCEDEQDYQRAMAIAAEQKRAKPTWKYTFTVLDGRWDPDALALWSLLKR